MIHLCNINDEVIIVPTEKPRFCITVDNELMERIDDFRFKYRYNSRSQATLHLIRLGLDALKAKEDAAKKSEKLK